MFKKTTSVNYSNHLSIVLNRVPLSLTHLGPSPPFWGLPEPGEPSSPRFWSPRWSGQGIHRSSDALHRPWSWIPHRPLPAGRGDELWMLVKCINCIQYMLQYLFNRLKCSWLVPPKDMKSNIPAYQVFDIFLCRALRYCCQYAQVDKIFSSWDRIVCICFHCIYCTSFEQCNHDRTNQYYTSVLMHGFLK